MCLNPPINLCIVINQLPPGIPIGDGKSSPKSSYGSYLIADVLRHYYGLKVISNNKADYLDATWKPSSSLQHIRDDILSSLLRLNLMDRITSGNYTLAKMKYVTNNHLLITFIVEED